IIATIQRPVTGCRITVGVVKSQSASTTWRFVTAMCSRLPLRSAIHLYQAVPRPVPNSRTMLKTCKVFRLRYDTRHSPQEACKRLHVRGVALLEHREVVGMQNGRNVPRKAGDGRHECERDGKRG